MNDEIGRATTLALARELPAFWMDDRELKPINSGSLSPEILSAFHFYLSLDRYQLPKLKPPFHNQLIKHIDRNNLITFSVVRIRKDGISGFIFGPFIEKGTDTSHLKATLLSIPGNRFTPNSAEKAIESIPQKDKLFIEALGNVALSYLTKGKEEYRRISTIKSSGNYFYQDGTLQSFEDNLLESDILANTTFEKEIAKLISLGDKNKLKSLLIPHGSIEENKLELLKLFGSGSSIYHMRDIKNALIGLNSIFRITSESTGLPLLYLHSLSDETMKEIERIRDKEETIAVIGTMIERYTDAINHVTSPHQSPLITKIQSYLMSNIAKDVSLEDLSRYTRKNPSYLSRRFRKETHMTVKSYMNMLRINKAKELLKTSNSSILDISMEVGFSDQSHFAQVFKKNVGLTPRMYRKINYRLP